MTIDRSLRNTINSHIIELGDDRAKMEVGDKMWKHVGEAEPVLLPEDALYRVLWGKHLHLKDVIPLDEWCQQHGKSLSNKSIAVGGNNIKLKIPKGFWYPPNENVFGTMDVDPLDVVDELKPYVDAAAVAARIKKEWGEIADKVTEYLGNFRLMSKALEKWTELEAFLPPDVKNQLRQESEQKTAAVKKAAKASPESLVRGLAEKALPELVALNLVKS